MKRFLCLLLVICVLISISFTTVYAIDPAKRERLLSEPYDKEWEKDPAFWMQGYCPNINERISTRTDKTIGGAACSSFSTAYAMVKMGELFPKQGETPYDLILRAREKGGYASNGWHLDFERVPDMYPNVKFEGYKPLDYSPESSLALAKGYMEEEGFYVVACLYHPVKNPGGHYIFIDGFLPDGDISIGDSWYPCITWNQYYGPEGWGFSHFYLLSKEGYPSTKQPSIYDDVDLSHGLSEEERGRYYQLLEERELRGMDFMNGVISADSVPQYANRDFLTNLELNNIENIKDGVNTDKLTVESVSVLLSRVLGMLVIVYSVLLFAAFLFDRGNTLFDVSLVSVLTLGSVKVTEDNDVASIQKRHLKPVLFILFVAIVLMIGLWVFNLGVLKLIYKIRLG